MSEFDEEAKTGIYVRTIEVQWHYSAPEDLDAADKHGIHGKSEGIISIDLSPAGDRFVTTGGDSSIMIWQLNTENVVRWLKNATAQDMSRCCSWITTMKCQDMPRSARFSPSGLMIASSHSDPRIRIWWRVFKEDLVPEREGTECWKDMRVLTGHLHDVMDISFSPDSRHLVSAGMLGTVIVHDLDQSAPVISLEAHSKFCYGVACDPWNAAVASFGGGPGLMFHSVVPRTESRRMQLVGQRKSQASFHGEGCGCSMRRLSWSPDGSLLAVPFGKVASSSAASESTSPDMKNCVNIFLRNQQEPSMRLTVRGQSEIRGALWAPSFFEPLSTTCKHPPEDDAAEVAKQKMSWGPSEYRMALAVWTEETVIVYTTDQGARHSDFTDLHMLGIADVTWSPDSRLLLTCSLDGYVSVLYYERPIGTAHRLPTFAKSPIPQAISTLLSDLRQQSRSIEESRTKMLNSTTVAVHATVVKKKRRVEKVNNSSEEVAATTVPQEMNVEELESIVYDL